MNVRIWERSLIARLVLFFSLVMLVGVLLLGVLGYVRARSALRDATLLRLETMAVLKESEINRWVQDQQQSLLLISALPDLRAQTALLTLHEATDPSIPLAYQALSAQLVLLAQNNPNVQELFILHPTEGKIIVSSQKSHEGQYRVNDAYYLAGRTGVNVQNVYPSPDTGRPMLTISAPIFDQNERLAGVLAMHLELERLDQVVFARAGLGQTGQAYLVDKFNVLVSAARYGNEEFPRGIHSAGIYAAVLDHQDGVGAYVNPRGEPVFGAYRWLDEREMALLVEVAQAEALAPAYRLASALALTGVLLSVLLVGSIYVLARQVSQPILVLTEVAKQVAAGKLDVDVPVVTKDEIGTLAQAFQSMIRDVHRAYSELERQVEERTAALKRRTTQITAAAEVSREALTIRDVDTLLQRVVTLISERFGYYHAGIFLVDENREYAVLRAASSEGGKRMLERQHRLMVGRVGIVGYVAAVGEPRIALDVGADAVFFNNPDLPETRSELALPLRVRGEVLGVLDVQSTEPEAFTEEDVDVLQVMADQLAAAIDNARLVRAAEERLREISLLLREQAEEGWQRFRALHELPAYAYDGLDVTEWSRDEALPTQYAATLEVRGEPIGRLGVLRAERPLHLEDMELVRVVAEQTSQALENARLFMETQSSLEEIDVLYRASQAMGEARSLSEVLNIFMDFVGSAVVDRAVLLLGLSELSGGSGEVRVLATWSPMGELPGLVGQNWFVPQETVFARATEEPFVADNLEARFLDSPSRLFLGQTLGFFSVVLLPLRLGGRLLGWVILGTSQTSYQPSARDLRLLRSLSDRLAVVVEGLRLLTETMERAERERLAALVAAQLRASLDPETILQTAVRELGRIFGARWSGVWLRAPQEADSPMEGESGQTPRQ